MTRTPAHPGQARSAMQGFTLLEVLVALGIVALTLTSGLRATQALGRSSERQSAALLAQLCAQNQLVAMRLQHGLPNLGESSSPCTQAGQNLVTHLTVQPTPNPNFRRVDAQVREGDVALLRLTTVIGRR